jgi:tryptophan synthase alpha chain
MNALQTFIEDERKTKAHLLMTHVVYGYPTVQKSLEIMQLMLDKGVELLEVQFPFSDPVADGPTITTACHHALEQEPTLEQYLKDISQLAKRNPDSRVLIMSYLNPLLQLGFDELALQIDGVIAGLIIPDLPIDHASMVSPLAERGIPIIWLITPDMSEERTSLICDKATGMLYCVSRSGVTGQASSKMLGLQQYISHIRNFTDLPLGVGFGINTSDDLKSVSGHADVAIVGSAFLNAYNQGGIDGLSGKLAELSIG